MKTGKQSTGFEEGGWEGGEEFSLVGEPGGVCVNGVARLEREELSQ